MLVSDLLTTKQVAEMLRVSPQTVGTFRKAKQLNYVKLGRKVLFTQENVREFIENQTTTNNSGE